MPVTNRFRVLKDTLGYSASALVAQGIGLVSGFWVARLLGPTEFGIWNAVSLVLVYGAYVDFGVLSAMGRDLPFHRGQGDHEKAAALDGAARRATIAGAVVAASVVLVASLFAAESPGALTGLRWMAVALVLQQVYTYHRTVLRADNEFGELSRQQLILAVLTGGLAVLGVTTGGLLGRLVAALIAQAAIVAYALWRNPWRPTPPLDRDLLWMAVKLGIPITLSGSIIALVTTVDRLMVVNFLGETQLGYFGLGLLLTSVVSLVPSMASQVLYPRITFQFGQSGRDLAALRAFVVTPPRVLSCLLPLVIGPLYIVLPSLIRRFLPAYAPGIAATRIVVLGIFFYSLLGLTDYFLVTTGKLKQYALFGGGALALNIGLDYLALRLGYGIEGVALAGTPITYLIYSTVVIGYALSHYVGSLGDRCRYFARLWLPFGYMLLLLWLTGLAVERTMRGTTWIESPVAITLHVVLFWIGSVPLLVAASRELKMDLSLASLARMRAGI